MRAPEEEGLPLACVQGKEYRYAYAVSAKLPASFGNALAKFDVKEGSVKQWHEAGCIPVEPLMVPRPGAQVSPSLLCTCVGNVVQPTWKSAQVLFCVYDITWMSVGDCCKFAMEIYGQAMAWYPLDWMF